MTLLHVWSKAALGQQPHPRRGEVSHVTGLWERNGKQLCAVHPTAFTSLEGDQLDTSTHLLVLKNKLFKEAFKRLC